MLPLAVWAYAYNPRVYTDLPRWPGVLTVLLVCTICNGIPLYFIRRSTSHYMGQVRQKPLSLLFPIYQLGLDRYRHSAGLNTNFAEQSKPL